MARPDSNRRVGRRRIPLASVTRIAYRATDTLEHLDRHGTGTTRGTPRLLAAPYSRMLDLDLVAAGGPLCVFELLHDARPVLLTLDEPGGSDITGWADRIRSIDASSAGTGSFRYSAG